MSGKFLVGVALFVVTAVLGAGLYTLWVGGETSRNWSNRLMRLRVVAQLIAVIIIIIVAYLNAR
jgi:hypothetical protein